MRTNNGAKRVAASSLVLVSLMLGQLPAGSQTRRGGAGQRPTPPSRQRPAETKPQEPIQQPAVTKPTAAWLIAPANPLHVSPVVSQNSGLGYVIMTATGGTFTATGPDGTRFTLAVPPGAVPDNVRVTMTPVVAVENLPFNGGLLAVVQITPGDLRLYKPATLVIEPPQPVPPEEQKSFAPFAYRDEGKEFHLYPMETEPSKIAFRLMRLGGYGVARGTEAERQAVRARAPTDEADRLSVLMQKVTGRLRERRLSGASRRAASGGEAWRFVKAAFEQEPTPQQGAATEDEAMQNLLKEMKVKLREAYDQVVMPRLKNARYKCDPSTSDTKDLGMFAEAVSGALAWAKQVELLGFSTRTDEVDISGSTFSEAELIERRRQQLRDEGWTDQEIQEMNKSADDFTKKIEVILELVPKLLKESFDALFRCCMQTKRPWAYPRVMMAAARQLALVSGGDPTGLLGEDFMGKVAQCACAAGGTGWWGTITHDETFEGAESRHSDRGKIGGKSERSWKESYAVTIDVRDTFLVNKGEWFDPADTPVNAFKAMANQSETYHSTGLRGCYKIIDRSFVLSGEEKGNTVFGVRFTADGRYSVHYLPPIVGVTGLHMSSSRAVGCVAYNAPTSNSGPMRRLVTPHRLEIEGVADPSNPDFIKGSKTVDIPVRKEGKRTGTVTWHLFRCKKR